MKRGDPAARTFGSLSVAVLGLGPLSSRGSWDFRRPTAAARTSDTCRSSTARALPLPATWSAGLTFFVSALIVTLAALATVAIRVERWWVSTLALIALLAVAVAYSSRTFAIGHSLRSLAFSIAQTNEATDQGLLRSTSRRTPKGRVHDSVESDIAAADAAGSHWRSSSGTGHRLSSTKRLSCSVRAESGRADSVTQRYAAVSATHPTVR